MKDDVILFPNNTAYLTGAKAIVTFAPSSREMFKIQDQDSRKPISSDDIPGATKERGIVPWGQDNDLPEQITNKIYKTPVLSSGMLFNIEMTYGEGIQAVFIDYGADGKKKILPYEMMGQSIKDRIRTSPDDKEKAALKRSLRVYEKTLEEWTTFQSNNDLSGWLLEQVTDLNFFYNVFPEVGFNLQDHGSRKLVELLHKEAMFSRWEVMNPMTGMIEKHFYSTKWGPKQPSLDPKKDVDVTPVLNSQNPTKHLREVMAKEKKDKTPANKRQNRWILPISFPTPGKIYYNKPYWYSIIESGWYDFAIKIPEAKNALMKNKMMIKYHIELSADYFPTIFKQEGITDEKKKKARVKQEYEDVTKFLTDAANKGKTVFSYTKKDLEGREYPDMKITVVENVFKSGEYIDDSEEVSNILSYGIGVHPSIIG